MIRAISTLTLCLSLQLSAFGLELDYLRANYDQAVTDKALCSKLIEELTKTSPTPVYLAYLGGLQTIWANHVFSPISKLHTFNQGKQNIERAVAAEPDNAEIRYVRLSIQKNAPSFLGYHSMIGTDETFLKTHRNQITSDTLQQKIDKLLEE